MGGLGSGCCWIRVSRGLICTRQRRSQTWSATPEPQVICPDKFAIHALTARRTSHAGPARMERAVHRRLLGSSPSTVCCELKHNSGTGSGGENSPQSVSGVLMLGGQPIGQVQGSATPDIRTVTPGQLEIIIDELKGLGATQVNRPRYRGNWYELSNNQGGFGVCNGSNNGRTVDVIISFLPDVTKFHQK